MQTNVTEFLTELDAGVFASKLGAALSEVALGVNSTGKAGEVTVTFTVKSMDIDRVAVDHKLKFKKPTKRGSKMEEDTTNTPMWVNKGGEMTILKKDQGQLFSIDGKAITNS